MLITKHNKEGKSKKVKRDLHHTTGPHTGVHILYSTTLLVLSPLVSPSLLLFLVRVIYMMPTWGKVNSKRGRRTISSLRQLQWQVLWLCKDKFWLQLLWRGFTLCYIGFDPPNSTEWSCAGCLATSYWSWHWILCEHRFSKVVAYVNSIVCTDVMLISVVYSFTYRFGIAIR